MAEDRVPTAGEAFFFDGRLNTISRVFTNRGGHLQCDFVPDEPGAAYDLRSCSALEAKWDETLEAWVLPGRLTAIPD